MSELILWDNMKNAVIECHSIDEISRLRNKAEAYRYALKQAKESPEVIRKAEEIKLRAERRAGELLKETPKAKGGGDVRNHPSNPTRSEKTLSDMGISYDQSSKWQKIANIPEEKFENYLEVEEELSTAGALKVAKNVHVSNNSGENSWYTPSKIINSAIKVMGEIDLDPASSELANETVKANGYYDKEDNGLTKEWYGRVWLNPPYSQPDIDDFSNAVLEKDYEEIMILVNNATETKWFQRLARKSDCICFINRRLKFIDKEGLSTGSPLQGQVVIYIGKNLNMFIEEFSNHGFCLVQP
jgi:ParB family chromosome partitioning protein